MALDGAGGGGGLPGSSSSANPQWVTYELPESRRYCGNPFAPCPPSSIEGLHDSRYPFQKAFLGCDWASLLPAASSLLSLSDK